MMQVLPTVVVPDGEWILLCQNKIMAIRNPGKRFLIRLGK